jgi:ArsR family transcriptional regulator
LKKKVDRVDNLKIKRLEQVFFSLTDKTRLTVLLLLVDEELCSCEIMVALDLTEPTTPHHPGILERADVVGSRRGGKWLFYRVPTARKGVLAKGSALVEETGEMAETDSKRLSILDRFLNGKVIATLGGEASYEQIVNLIQSNYGV